VRCGGTEMRHSRWNYPKPVRCIPAASLVFGMIALVACNTTDHREHNQNPSTHEVTVASNQPLPTPKKLQLEAANLTSQEVTALAQEGAPSWDSGLNQFRSVWRGQLIIGEVTDAKNTLTLFLTQKFLRNTFWNIFKFMVKFKKEVRVSETIKNDKK